MTSPATPRTQKAMLLLLGIVLGRSPLRAAIHVAWAVVAIVAGVAGYELGLHR
jgi:hypothetical protein